MTSIKISGELARELARQAGSKPRLAYAAQVLGKDIRRNRQRQSARESAGVWKAVVHRELATGMAGYGGPIRSEPDTRRESALPWQRTCQPLTYTGVTMAAVALEYLLPLLTHNRKHFPMPGIQLYPLP